MTQPLFTDEGPQFYAAAYAHNKPFATPGPYQTRLSQPEEMAFRQWVATKKVPFNPNEDPTDYDMRGYWKSTGGGKDWSGPGSHFPDTFKTPYDTTFSRESMYATPSCPFVWQEDNLVDSRNGQLIFGTPIRTASDVKPAHGYQDTWHLEAVSADGSRRVVEATKLGGSDDATDWSVELRPGETLEVKSSGNVTVT